MANPYYEEDGKTYLECKECGVSKELPLFYKHNQGFLGVMGRCRECIKQGRKSEHERVMARKRDLDRYYNNTKRRLYTTYCGIISRCYNKESKGYKNYGGRGIKCDWNSFSDFYEDMIDSFLLSVKEKGQKNTTIERINVNGNYSKNNCTRATLSEQARNRRNTVKYKGIPVIDLCEEKGLKYKTFMSRIYRGETMEEIITSLSR